jgi:hypothetical protein
MNDYCPTFAKFCISIFTIALVIAITRKLYTDNAWRSCCFTSNSNPQDNLHIFQMFSFFAKKIQDFKLSTASIDPISIVRRTSIFELLMMGYQLSPLVE